MVKLLNPDTATGFYIARQNDSTSTFVLFRMVVLDGLLMSQPTSSATTEFTLAIDTSAGDLTIPQAVPAITLGGRQSKVVVTDYGFGSSSLLYSTAQILSAGKIGTKDVLFLYGDTDQDHEISIFLDGNTTEATQAIPSNSSSSDSITFSSLNSTAGAANASLIAFTKGLDGLYIVHNSDNQLVLYADTLTATTFWAPTIASANSSDPLANFWQIGTNDTVLVGGPYLVRNASISADGSTLDLRGDLNASVTLSVIAPETVETVTWNGVELLPDSGASSALTFVGSLTMSSPSGGSNSTGIVAPVLEGWKYADSLPEVTQGVDFDDSAWVEANHTTTNIPFPMWYGDGRVLYGCDYGL